MRKILSAILHYAFFFIDSFIDLIRSCAGILLDHKGWRGGPSAARFVPFEQRAWFSGAAFSYQSFAHMQRAKWNIGMQATPPLNWKGVLCMKDPFEFTLYPLLLWELRPATVIELGSYAGGSAYWLADLLTAFGVAGKVYSFDIEPPKVPQAPDNVRYMYADSRDVDTLSEEFLKSLPHPWLVIEDAHENVAGVLRHIDKWMMPGDYLVVEDLHVYKRDKYRALSEFLAGTADGYRVDTHYTDMFCYNGTWNLNGYLRKM